MFVVPNLKHGRVSMITSMRQALVLPLKGRLLLAVALCFAEAFANASALTRYMSIARLSELDL